MIIKKINILPIVAVTFIIESRSTAVTKETENPTQDGTFKENKSNL